MKRLLFAIARSPMTYAGLGVIAGIIGTVVTHKLKAGTLSWDSRWGFVPVLAGIVCGWGLTVVSTNPRGFIDTENDSDDDSSTNDPRPLA